MPSHKSHDIAGPDTDQAPASRLPDPEKTTPKAAPPREDGGTGAVVIPEPPALAPKRDRIETLLSRHPGGIVVSAALLITTLMWVGAKIEFPGEAPLWPWRVPTQLSIDWALTLMALALVSASRSPLVEPMFGGLDRAVRMHRLLGPAAVGLVVIHIFLLFALYIAENRPVLDLIIPFRSNWVFDTFIFTTLGFLVLAVLAYVTRMAYERWRIIHGLNGVLFVPSMFVSMFIDGSISDFEPFRLWMGFLTFAGLGSLFHRYVLFRRSGPRHVYEVARIVPRDPGAFDLVLDPVGQRMAYAPGKFVFISIAEGGHWSHDLHPFSLSSTPVLREVRLSIREVGDFTRRLRQLSPGHQVRLYGPYGSFTLHSVAAFDRVVCIGAGIGIAPFLGMLEFERTNDERRRIWLTYVVRDRGQAPYDGALEQAAAELERVDYRLWVSSDEGRFTASAIAAIREAPQTTAVMMCGPGPMLTDLINQLRELGVPNDNIYAEGFAFR